MMSSILVGAVLLSSFGHATAGLITFFPGATDFRIANITGVDIGGTLFDAKFHHGISFDALELLPVSTFTFFDPVEAAAAAAALDARILAAGVDASGATDVTDSHLIPIVPSDPKIPPPSVLAFVSVFLSPDPLEYAPLAPAGFVQADPSRPTLRGSHSPLRWFPNRVPSRC